MNKLYITGLILITSGCNLLLGDNPSPTPLKDGISLSLGTSQAEIRVAAPHAFRLHVFSPGEPTASPSIFLTEHALPAATFSVTRDGPIVGLKTEFGELLVDPIKQLWSLRDGSGKTLTDWASLRPVDFATGPSPAKPNPLYYGSGNDPERGALTQTESHSQAGNGST